MPRVLTVQEMIRGTIKEKKIPPKTNAATSNCCVVGVVVANVEIVFLEGVLAVVATAAHDDGLHRWRCVVVDDDDDDVLGLADNINDG